MPAPNEITVKNLSRLIGKPDCPLIVDIRIVEDLDDDAYLIPSSICRSHQNLDEIAALGKDKPVVIVCQKGLKLSQGVASWLRSEGVVAEYLQGGMFAWRDAHPDLRLPLTIFPQGTGYETLWVTRHRPKIDRIACPWLIRRFVDRNARFLFVEPSQVLNVADRFQATAFDVADAPYTHTDGMCTFDAMLKAFGLSSPALNRMADVVRGADLGNPEETPQSSGLSAVAIGMSRMFRDDHEQLEQSLVLYDALYRWARDGFDEKHGLTEHQQ